MKKAVAAKEWFGNGFLARSTGAGRSKKDGIVVVFGGFCLKVTKRYTFL